jgi:hypothetical protein
MMTRNPGASSLVASLLPGAVFASALPIVGLPRPIPWELAIIGVAGTVATAAGVGDWLYHRRAGVAIGPNERRGELLALCCGGLPLFVLLSFASFSAQPLRFLIPTIVAALVTTVMICHDEFVFHRRRCKLAETLLHRSLVFGHAIAFLAWSHWCFVRGLDA